MINKFQSTFLYIDFMFLLTSFEKLILQKTFYEYIQIICSNIEKNIIVKDRLICYCNTVWYQIIDYFLSLQNKMYDVFHVRIFTLLSPLVRFYFPNHLEL